MAADEWWLPELRGDLSQGDVLGPLDYFSPFWPLKHLRHTPLRGNTVGWAESEERVKGKTGLFHVLGHTKAGPGIIVSHDCEIDKPNKGSRIQVAHIIELKDVPEELANKIRQQQSFRYMPLPGIPNFGDCAVDFRMITPFPADVVFEVPRVASLTDDARIRLQAAMWAFFTRREEFGAPAEKPTVGA